MDQCRLSVAATGSFLHPLGDQTPIDCRYGETIDTVDLPHKQILTVDAPCQVNFRDLVNPRAVIVWNVSGEGLQVQPTEAEAAAIAAKVLQVGLVPTEVLKTLAGGSEQLRYGLLPAVIRLGCGWQELRPAKPTSGQGGSTVLWLSPDTQVILRPATPGINVRARVLVLPGQ